MTLTTKGKVTTWNEEGFEPIILSFTSKSKWVKIG